MMANFGTKLKVLGELQKLIFTINGYHSKI